MDNIGNTWMLWAILLVITSFGLWAEGSRWGARTSAVVIVLVTAMVATGSGVLPKQSPVYDIIRTYLVPLAIPMLILKANVVHGWRDLGMVAGASLLSIISAIVGTLLVLVSGLLPASVDHHHWITGTLSGVVGGQSSTPVQGLLLTGYLILLFLLPSIRSVREWFHEPIPDDRWGSTVQILVTEHRKGNRLYLLSITLTLALSAIVCAASYAVAPTLRMTGMELLLIATVSLLLSLVLPKRVVQQSGAEEIGILIMLLLFAVIGASTDLTVVARQPGLLASTGLVLLIQTLLLLVLGKLLHLSLPQLVIAANAGVGGGASATAMAATRRWPTLLFPAILFATIGEFAAGTLVKLILGWVA